MLLVSDEVICGFGRLGEYFGAQRFGYQPDIITCAKGLTSGYVPAGAMLVSDRLAEPFRHGANWFAHGVSFGGHPVASAVALANLDLFVREDLNAHVARSTERIVVCDGKVLLLRNEREEWELPGGRIEIGETPEECVSREILEETQWNVETGPILDTWMYYINAAEKHVFIVTYGCYPVGSTPPVVSSEHKEVRLFSEDEVPTLNMPDGYKRSIATWYARLRESAPELTG